MKRDNPFLFPEMEEPLPTQDMPPPDNALPDTVITAEMVAAASDPIIIWGSWSDAIPSWLKNHIRKDRVLLLIDQKTREIGTDSEALAYICSASLEFPLDHDWATIYQYLLTKVFGSLGRPVPEDLSVSEISGYQIELLSKLKVWIYGARKKSRTKTSKRKKVSVTADTTAVTDAHFVRG